MEVYRTFKYRLLPSKAQHRRLSEICESQRVLYNAALEERIGYYGKMGKTRSFFDQCRQLTVLRKDKEYSDIALNVQRWTLKRLDDAYRAFFSRGGFPRFRSQSRWRSFGLNELDGLMVKGNKVFIKGLNGAIRIHLHRPIPGEIKSCVFTRDLKGWNVSLQCGIEVKKIQVRESEIGIDVGLETFATLSNGEKIPNPRIAQKAERQLRRKQRALSRCKKGSKRRGKVKERLARAHYKIANIRKDFLHKQSSRLAKTYSRISVEDLQIKNMVKSNMARSIHDASWGTFMNMLAYKVESTGGTLIKVNPYNTSQACSGCGQIVRKSLKDRVHKCDCGTVLDRDHNAALNILSRGGSVPWQPNVTEYRERAVGNHDHFGSRNPRAYGCGDELHRYNAMAGV